MDLKFSEMSVDTRLAQAYLKENKELLELLDNYNDETINKIGMCYDGEMFFNDVFTCYGSEDIQSKLINMASSLQENANLITQLEYHIRNIPIEDTNVQLNLLIQYLKYLSQFSKFTIPMTDSFLSCKFQPNTSLLEFGNQICWLGRNLLCLAIKFREIVPIWHLLLTLMRKAGYENYHMEMIFMGEDEDYPENMAQKRRVIGLGSGTVAVVSGDADVDSAVDKFISVSKQVPWRLRRVLVQESVYQTFKDALNWKCNLKKTMCKQLTCDVSCTESLSYNDRTFLLDPVEPTEHDSSVVAVEAYRTTKEMLDLLQQDKPYYLSLWTNGIAEINEVTRSTEAPLVWVNSLADFRGPLAVTAALFTDINSKMLNPPPARIKKCAKVTKLCQLSQSWLSLDFDRRRDILCGVLDKLISSNKKNKTNKMYTALRNSFCEWNLNSFVEVGKDYVCIGTLRPRGIIAIMNVDGIITVEFFKSLLLGNALYVYGGTMSGEPKEIAVLEEAGVPVVYSRDYCTGDFDLIFCSYFVFPTRIRVTWTNSGTIFAN